MRRPPVHPESESSIFELHYSLQVLPLKYSPPLSITAFKNITEFSTIQNKRLWGENNENFCLMCVCIFFTHLFLSQESFLSKL